MRNYYVALILVALLAGCQTTRAKIVEYRDRIQRQEQVERIVERTITKPQLVTKEVEKLVRLPAGLMLPCPPVRAADRSVGAITEAYKLNFAAQKNCDDRMKMIRDLQPAK